MNKICLVILSLASVNVLATTTYNLQEKQCFPNTEEAKSWPVQAIYLSGLYGPGVKYDETENSYRVFLEKYARENRIRIAVPVARVLNGTHQWNQMSLESIESQASAACGGAPLASQRAMIGYSNGGRYAGELSAQCGTNQAYTKFVVIGYPGAVRGNCEGMKDRYSAIVNHGDFGPMARSMDTQLAALPRNNGETAVASADTKRAIESARVTTGRAMTPQRRNAEAPTPPTPATPKEPTPTKPAAQAKAPAKAAPDNCCQGECTSLDIGLNLETAGK